MFKCGEKVVSISNGICTIHAIVEMDMSGQGVKKYYELIPECEQGTKLYIPLDSAKERLRKTMSKKEALKVIESIQDLPELEIENEKDREKRYKEAVKSSDPTVLVATLKSIYYRRKMREAEGKKSTVIDDKYHKLTLRKLHSELAYVLDCTEEDIMRMVHEHLD